MLNTGHSLRMARGMKEMQQKITVMPNPSEIDQNHLLLVRFSNLGSDDVIILGMATLSFNIKLSMLVSNVGRAIVKKLAVKFKGNEVLGVD